MDLMITSTSKMVMSSQVGFHHLSYVAGLHLLLPYEGLIESPLSLFSGLIHKCYLAEENGTDFTIWGSGAPLRQFIFNRDLAELTIWVMRDYHVSKEQLKEGIPSCMCACLCL